MKKTLLATGVIVGLTACGGGTTPAPTDGGRRDTGMMMGTDAGMMMGTDAGMMMGTDAGMMMGTDAGMMMGTDAGMAVSYADVHAIFQLRCRSCHAAGHFTMLDLSGTPAQTYAEITGADPMVAGCEIAAYVTPGDPDASRVYRKVSATQPATCGGPMPAGTPGLSAAEAATIRAWIAAGASGP